MEKPHTLMTSTLTQAMPPLVADVLNRLRVGERDYFKLQSEHGQWLWVFYDPSRQRWFMHGRWG